jgi:MoxR-like ATPase
MSVSTPTGQLGERLADNVGRVLLGKQSTIQLATIALFADGHLLIEDNPGVGKTLLARALAKSLDLPFQRVQCTADLLPADILGGPVYRPATGDVVFRPGPVFTSVLVADELNRTPPRTQSALLQCMQERKVTIDRTTHDLLDPFFVVATHVRRHLSTAREPTRSLHPAHQTRLSRQRERSAGSGARRRLP